MAAKHIVAFHLLPLSRLRERDGERVATLGSLLQEKL
jgi:hypothetical protein